MTPYRGWMLWHHVSGLAGGVMLTTWIVSGWLSVDPGHAFAGARLRRRQCGSMRGGRGSRAISTGWPGSRQMRAPSSGAGTPGSRPIAIDRASPHPLWLEQATLAPARAADPLRAAMLVPDGRRVAWEWLARPDFYWTDASRLPLWRLRFDDAAATWLYVDPMSGALVERQDGMRRAYRWVYTLLHTWDWPWLTAHFWVWTAGCGLVAGRSGAVDQRCRARMAPVAPPCAS